MQLGCPKCPSTFSSSDLLRTHFKRIHLQFQAHECRATSGNKAESKFVENQYEGLSEIMNRSDSQSMWSSQSESDHSNPRNGDPMAAAAKEGKEEDNEEDGEIKEEKERDQVDMTSAKASAFSRNLPY